MKVVRTALTEDEYKLLEEYARRESKSIKEILREAIRIMVEGGVVPEDPIFTRPPSSRRTGRTDDGSIEHDRYLSGEMP
jgi:hypothetical protein